MKNIFGIGKGEKCNRNGCAGIIQEHETDNQCSCHINPPCSYCTEDRNYCPECDWQAKDDYAEPVISDEQRESWRKANEEWQERRDSFYKKYNGTEPITELEIRCEPHTHFSQIQKGIFPEGTQTQESLLPKIKGTFGGRFSLWGKNKFEYVAYTD